MMGEALRIVTIKLPKNPQHDPHHKIAGPCPVSDWCTDSTGEHHTTLVKTDAEVAALREQFGHITRIEDVK